MKSVKVFDMYDVAQGATEFLYDDLEMVGMKENLSKPFDRRYVRRTGDFRRNVSTIKSDGLQRIWHHADVLQAQIDEARKYQAEKLMPLWHMLAWLLKEAQMPQVSELPQGVTRVENAEDLKQPLLSGDGSIILPDRGDDLPKGVKRHNSAKQAERKSGGSVSAKTSGDGEAQGEVQPAYLSCRQSRKGKQKFRRDHPARKNSH